MKGKVLTKERCRCHSSTFDVVESSRSKWQKSSRPKWSSNAFAFSFALDGANMDL